MEMQRARRMVIQAVGIILGVTGLVTSSLASAQQAQISARLAVVESHKRYIRCLAIRAIPVGLQNRKPVRQVVEQAAPGCEGARDLLRRTLFNGVRVNEADRRALTNLERNSVTVVAEALALARAGVCSSKQGKC